MRNVFETEEVADTGVFGLDLGWRTGLAFIVGAACSMAQVVSRLTNWTHGDANSVRSVSAQNDT